MNYFSSMWIVTVIIITFLSFLLHDLSAAALREAIDARLKHILAKARFSRTFKFYWLEIYWSADKVNFMDDEEMAL